MIPLMLNSYCTTLIFIFVIACTPLTTKGQQFEPYTFEVQGVGTIEAERGQVLVPENRSSAESRIIPIHFVRLQSRAQNPGPPIMYLAGGPGGSGTGAMRGRRWAMFDQLRNIADVIILDQRGTGLSSSVPLCESSVQIPADSAATREMYVRLHKEAWNECLDFWQNEGIDIRGYTTMESAADIEAVRNAIGEERLNLLGISYGTHLALATLKRYPSSIDRLVLASAEGLNHTVKRPALTEAYFDRLQSVIDSDSVSHSYYPDVKGLIKGVLNRIEVHPEKILVSSDPEIYHTLSKFEMQLVTGFMISDPRNVNSILKGFTDASNGDFNWFRNFLSGNLRDNRIRLHGMPEAMDLASGISTERLLQIEEEAATALLGDVLNFPIPHLLGVAPEIDLGEAFREPVSSDRPALFLSGTLDGRTYPKAHEEIAVGFSNSAIVTIENAGHNLFFSHPDLVDIVANFFNGDDTKDQTLTADLPRFIPD